MRYVVEGLENGVWVFYRSCVSMDDAKKLIAEWEVEDRWHSRLYGQDCTMEYRVVKRSDDYEIR